MSKQSHLFFVSYSIFLLSVLSCSNSKRLTVAFTTFSDLSKGLEVRIAGLPVGYVYDIRPNKNLDTLFTILKLNHKIKIPKGSQFYIDEGFIGDSRINIEFSKNDTYLNSKDISLGIFRPMPSHKMTAAEIDSVKKIFRLSLSRIDSIKKN